MSFFGGKDAEPTGPSPIALAKIEGEIMTEMFNRMSNTCFKKCVPAYHDGELTVGEMSCVDRCVSKYMQAQEKVGEVLNNLEKQMAAQQQMGMGMQQQGTKFGPSGKM